MNFAPQNEQELKPEFNLISMVDIVLQLVIFFMLTTHFVLQSGINVKLPQAAPTKVESNQELTVTITKENKIFLNRDKVTVEELPQALKSVLEKNPGQKLLVVRADKEVLHGTVVTVMDIGKKLGVENLAIATESSTK